MNQAVVICGIVLTLGMGPLPARADGPCSDDIGRLTRQLGGMAGLGAPISEPSAGLSAGKKAGQMPNTSADASASDRAQPGGASLAGGGSPGTVGGVAGSAGTPGSKDAVATGQVATSAEDVRRQSVGKPTMAQEAASGKASGSAAPVDMSSEDKTSKAKMALQRAVDLNAKGDNGCMAAVTEVRNLMPKD